MRPSFGSLITPLLNGKTVSLHKPQAIAPITLSSHQPFDAGSSLGREQLATILEGAPAETNFVDMVSYPLENMILGELVKGSTGLVCDKSSSPEPNSEEVASGAQKRIESSSPEIGSTMRL